MIRFKVNGKEYTRDEPVKLLSFMEELIPHQKSVIVEYNNEFLQRDSYIETVINDGDKLEIVRAIGGG